MVPYNILALFPEVIPDKHKANSHAHSLINIFYTFLPANLISRYTLKNNIHFIRNYSQIIIRWWL